MEILKKRKIEVSIILVFYCSDSFKREEHRLRSTVTSGPRSLPRPCSGFRKSWWRRSDMVRVTISLSFRNGEMTRSSQTLPPPLQRRGRCEADLFTPDLSWSHFVWHFDVFLSSQKGNYLSIIYIHQCNKFNEQMYLRT